MGEAVVAKCEHCGAALRVDSARRGAITCEYCQTQSVLRAPGDGGVPELRIGSPARLPSGAGCFAVVALGMAALSIASCVEPFVHEVDSRIVSFSGGSVMMLLAVGAGLATRASQRRRLRAVHLRESGVPGRATVERIVAGQDRSATLTLRVELTGRPTRELDHTATVPELLVPRLVDGLTLPVLVDPDNGEHLEVQWHLV